MQKAKRLSLLEKTPIITCALEIGWPSASIYYSSQVGAKLGYQLHLFEKDLARCIKVLHPEDQDRILAEDVWAGTTGSRSTRSTAAWPATDSLGPRQSGGHTG